MIKIVSDTELDLSLDDGVVLNGVPYVVRETKHGYYLLNVEKWIYEIKEASP